LCGLSGCVTNALGGVPNNVSQSVGGLASSVSYAVNGLAHSTRNGTKKTALSVLFVTAG
jgi:hypothetical protein